jgi:hypothetical protein
MGRAKDPINQRYTVNEKMPKDVALNLDQPYIAAKKSAADCENEQRLSKANRKNGAQPRAQSL